MGRGEARRAREPQGEVPIVEDRDRVVEPSDAVEQPAVEHDGAERDRVRGVELRDVALVATERAEAFEDLGGAGDRIGPLDYQPRCRQRCQRAARRDRVDSLRQMLGGKAVVGFEKGDVLAANHPQAEVARRAGGVRRGQARV